MFLAETTTVGADIGKAEGRGYFMVGTNTIDIGDLNTRLKNEGYREFLETFMALGGGGYAMLDRFIIGGEGIGLLTGDESGTIGSETFKTSFDGGYGIVKLGYLFYQHNGLNLYPTIGFGGGSMKLNIKKSETVSFDDILKNPKRTVSLSTSCLIIDIGIGIDYLMVMESGSEGDRGGIVFGAKIGYLVSPYREDWGDAINGPDISMEGFYFRLTLGGGGGKTF